MSTTEQNTNTGKLTDLFTVGAHFGMIRSRRHPSAKPYIFGVKNKIEIFDLEKTEAKLQEAKEFVKSLGRERATILFVGGKNEAQASIQKGAEEINMPYVAGRWLGGTLTNFEEIKKRIEKLSDLKSQKEKGELGKYTKKERLLIDRDIEYLERFFGGLSDLTTAPKAMFVIDSKREHIAVHEAGNLNVPVIALASSDCDLKEVQFPIPGNDASVSSISYFVKEIVSAYKEGLLEAPTKKEELKTEDSKA